ncbi:MAG TPA: NFACT family protein [Nitrospirota bacterium]|nr:NFACT family protein [Nitrospirota bacterium]
MDYDMLVPVVEELSSFLTGARVERALQGEDGGLYLLFRKDRKNFAVLLSPDRSLPRLHLVSRKPRSASDPHPLVLNLRRRLPGGRLAHITLLNDDRVVEFHFVKNDAEYHLIFELTGSSSNLYFSDADLRILAVYHAAPAKGKARRMLIPGVPYVLPQKKARIAPQGVLASAGQGSPNERAESYYRGLAIQRQTTALRTELRSSLAKDLKRVERRRAAIEEDLRAAQRAETYRQKGDLILANLGKLKTGMVSAKLSGYDGVQTVIELDARLTPKENAESHFRKYKKAKAGLPLIEERMRRTDEEITDIRTRIAELEQAGDDDLLLLRQSGTRGAPTAETGHKEFLRKPPGVSGIRKVLYRGWEILVGVNAAANDELSVKLARPDDLWLHAEGLPGSHILVRNPRKGEIPSEILLKAAGIAAMHSKGKTAAKVAVAYTYARFVRKPKGAKPGLVHLTRRRTVMVKPDDDAAR